MSSEIQSLNLPDFDITAFERRAAGKMDPDNWCGSLQCRQQNCNNDWCAQQNCNVQNCNDLDCFSNTGCQVDCQNNCPDDNTNCPKQGIIQ